MKLTDILKEMASLFDASEPFGLQIEAVTTVISTLCPDLTAEQLVTAINAAICEWDL